MERFIDLHTHSTYSDGSLTPEEIVKLAKQSGLSAIALTDHDTVEGLPEAIAAGEKYGIEIITGIEFSVKYNGTMHMLGLGFSLPCPEISGCLDSIIKGRTQRNIQTIEKLNELGIEITMEEIAEMSSTKILGRSQMAQLMIKKGYTSTIKEGFDKYLSYGRPAYVSRDSLSPEEAIRIIKNSGGKAVLAHLNQLKLPDDELFALLKKLKDCGLDGVEGYYTEYTNETGEKYRQMAKELGLILSGGSDFHGENKDNYFLGKGRGNLRIPYELLESILDK